MSSQQNNVNNTLNCAMCDNMMIDGIIRDNSYYCNTTCYQNKMFFDNLSQVPQVPQVPQMFKNSSLFQKTHPVSQTSVNQKTVTTQSNNQRSYGTCNTCQNKYNFKYGSIDMGDKWYCGKTCSKIHVSGQNMHYPAVVFPFASNTQTVFPLHVDSRAGKIFF